MSDNTSQLTVTILLEELKEVDKWYMLGAYLSVPVHELNKIETTKTQNGVERCKLQMLQYWLDNSMKASWKDIAKALEHLSMVKLSEKLKLKYLRTSPATTPDVLSSAQPSSPHPCDTDLFTYSSTQPSTQPSTHATQPCTHPCTQHPSTQSSTQRSTQSSTQPSTHPSTQPSTQPSTYTTQPSTHPSTQPSTQPSTYTTHPSTQHPSNQSSTQSSTQPSTQPSTHPSTQPSTHPSSQPSIQPSTYTQPSTHHSTQHLSTQSSTHPSTHPSTQPYTHILLEELGKKAFILITCIVVIIAVAAGYHRLNVEQQEELLTANKSLAAQETELNEMRRRVGDLEEFVISYFPSSLVQITGELTTAGKETTFELSLSSKTSSSLLFLGLFKHLSCQLTDPHHQHIHCSINSTQPGVCTVKYTPKLRGPYQLRITISGTEIAGSPFIIQVLPSPEMQHTISGFNRPWGVAVSKSGEVVVSEHTGHCISVYSSEGKKIKSFGSEGSGTGQFKYPRGVAITSDNHILVADGYNHRIQMFTMEGKFVKSVGQKGQQPLQFQYPSGIAVHPSGRVFVAEKYHRIQVLNPDLSYSHMFGREGMVQGQFNHPRDLAINSSGVVYVADYYNHRVQLFSADGQFISTFGSEGSQHGQLNHPTSISIDSTNTVYVADNNHRVSVYTNNGQFIKCFGTQGSGEGELNYPEGVAVDKTTGALYVCDYSNDRVVVY